MPAPHRTALAFVDPAGHAYPGAHGPLQLLVIAPVTSPYRPASHGPLQPAVALPLTLPYSPALQATHTLAPVKLYCPALHCTAVAFVDPAGHAYPATHVPLQLLFVSAATLPNTPGGHATQLVDPDVLYDPTGHGPLQFAFDSPLLLPTYPALQFMHTLSPVPSLLPLLLLY